MKKLMIALFFFLLFHHHAHAFSPVRQVQISTNSIPQQSGYYNVAGGTVTNLANYNQISSGTYTVNGATFSWMNGVSTGTRIERSTITWQQGENSGLRNDNSTTTLISAGINGTFVDASSGPHTGVHNFSTATVTDLTVNQLTSSGTWKLNNPTLTGTITDSSTVTYTGGHTFENGILVSTTPTNAQAVFQVSATSITVNNVVNIATAPGKGVSLQVNSSSVSTNSPTYIYGTQTNDSAASGYIGEFISTSAARAGTAIASNTSTSTVMITLTAGDWDAWANCAWDISSGTPSSTGFDCAISLTASTLPSGSEGVQDSSGQIILFNSTGFTAASDEDQSVSVRSRISITTTTKYYLVSRVIYGSGAVKTYGSFYARRAR